MLFVPIAIGEIWQVFWLGVYFNAFPCTQWRRLKLLEALLPEGSEAPYSYGDSAGFSPTSLLICFVIGCQSISITNERTKSATNLMECRKRMAIIL